MSTTLTAKKEAFGQVAAGRLSDFVELGKPRVNLLVLLTTAAGFYLGATSWSFLRFVLTLCGTGLVAYSASALNMVLEKESDARMDRTKRRPIPSGRVSEGQAYLAGVGTGAAGLLLLAFFIGGLTAFFAGLSLAVYVLAYTPLKRVSSLSTLVGAVAGALPPVIGWTAATSQLGVGAAYLFAILFFWQVPHFLAIGWIYREDYARAGLPQLWVEDPTGGSTCRQAVLYALALAVASLSAFFFRVAGETYFWVALGLGAYIVFETLRFSVRRTAAAARRLLLASVVYLPLLLVALVWDKLV